MSRMCIVVWHRWSYRSRRLWPWRRTVRRKTHRAAWMAKGTFGVMTHYLVTPKGNTPAERTADFNRTVDRFDLDGYIRQFQETGADWLIFTLGQTTGYLCSPNAYLDAKAPGHTSRRNLALEIARRLKALGKRLILYIPSEENAEPVIQEALGLSLGGTRRPLFRVLTAVFAQVRHAPRRLVVRQLRRASGRVLATLPGGREGGQPAIGRGLQRRRVLLGPAGQPDLQTIRLSRRRDPLLEDGRIRRDFLWPPGNDMVLTADRKLRKRGQEARFYLPDGGLIDGIQWHCLLPIDLTFNPAIPNQFCHYTDKELCRSSAASRPWAGRSRSTCRSKTSMATFRKTPIRNLCGWRRRCSGSKKPRRLAAGGTAARAAKPRRGPRGRGG